METKITYNDTVYTYNSQVGKEVIQALKGAFNALKTKCEGNQHTTDLFNTLS